MVWHFQQGYIVRKSMDLRTSDTAPAPVTQLIQSTILIMFRERDGQETNITVYQTEVVVKEFDLKFLQKAIKLTSIRLCRNDESEVSSVK